MDMPAWVEAAVNSGMSIVIIVYFLFKDYRFNDQIINTLTSIREVLTELKTWHAREDEK